VKTALATPFFLALGCLCFAHRRACVPAYSPRIVDAELLELLASAGAVVIEGPKACGKTMTASQQAASRVLLDIDQSARLVLAVHPGLLLEGARPRLLD
jgi:hypothetical protein